MPRHSTEQMESDVRCCCCSDQYPKVSRPDSHRRDGCHDACQECNADGTTSLLNDPNTGSPANVEASNLYKDNRKEYTKRVRETVEKSWED